TATKPGRSSVPPSSSLLTSEPSVGYWIGPPGARPVCMRYVAREWSASLVLIERMIAIRFICLASLGRCSPILMPGTEVAISLNLPPLACPGLRSNRSIVDGPPDIHNRMHERLRCGMGAAARAKSANHPDADAPRAPAAESFSQLRRVRKEVTSCLLK